MAKPLGLPERSVLIHLAIEGGQMISSDMKKKHGIQPNKPQRAALVARGLVREENAPRGSKLLMLTDEGWAFLDDGLTREALPRGSSLGSGGRALFALLPMFAARGYSLRSLLTDAPAGPEVKRPKPAPKSVEDRIANAYRQLAKEPRDWVALTALRRNLADVDRETLDATLHKMRRDKVLTMTLEVNQSRLTKEDRAAALKVGSDNMHYMSMG